MMPPVAGDVFQTRTTLGQLLNVYLVVGVTDGGYVKARRVYTYDCDGRHYVADGPEALFTWTDGVEWFDESPLYLEGYAAWARVERCPFADGPAALEWMKGYYAAEADGVAYAERMAERAE